MNRKTIHHTLATSIRRLSCGAATLGLALAFGARPAGAADWKWTVAPYVWATDIGVDVKIDDEKVVDETIPVNDIIDDIDTIAQIRFEGQRGAHGFLIDVFDVTLSDEVRGLELPKSAGTAGLNSDVGMTIVDIAGIYDPKGDRQGFSFIYGARLIDQRAEIDAAFDLAPGMTLETEYETEDRLYDALVGVRFAKRFSRHWGYQMQADVSKGGTDYTWSAGPSVSYIFGKTDRYALTGGYRRMVVDFKDEDDVEARMTLSGFLVGLRFSF